MSKSPLYLFFLCIIYRPIYTVPPPLHTQGQGLQPARPNGARMNHGILNARTAQHGTQARTRGATATYAAAKLVLAADSLAARVPRHTLAPRHTHVAHPRGLHVGRSHGRSVDGRDLEVPAASTAALPRAAWLAVEAGVRLGGRRACASRATGRMIGWPRRRSGREAHDRRRTAPNVTGRCGRNILQSDRVTPQSGARGLGLGLLG